MTEKKNDFVVSDRRRFGAEGEPLAGARVEEEEKTVPQAPPQPAQHKEKLKKKVCQL